MQVKEALFEFRGRLGRRQWWELALLLFLAQAMTAELAALVILGFDESRFGVVHLAPSLPRALIETAAAALVAFPHVALAVKRRHDLGQPGRLTAAGVIALLPLEGAARIFVLPDVGLAAFAPMLILAALAVRAWLFVVLGCLGGAADDNVYGPPPSRGGAPVEVFS